MAVSIEIARDALVGMAGLTAARAGLNEPACALHLRRPDEFGLHLAATDGSLIAFARLVAGSSLLHEVLWNPDEEPIISFRINDTATAAALTKLDKTVLLNVYEGAAFIHSTGDDGSSMEIKLPRVRMVNRNPFMAISAVLTATREQLTPVGQAAPPLAALNAVREAGRKLGLAEAPAVARLGAFWGISLGSSAEFWACCDVTTVETARTAGLMPDWIAETAPAEERLSFEAGMRQTMTIIGPEQAALPMEDAPEFSDDDLPAIPEDEETEAA